MAQIQMTEALSSALILRLQGEYGQQAMSNFALDILLDAANAEISRLNGENRAKDELNSALQERARVAEAQLEDLKRSVNPKRTQVMGAADRVKKMQVRARGADPHQ